MRELFSQIGEKYMSEYDENNITDEYFLTLLKKININDRVRVININRAYSNYFDEESYFTVKEWIVSRVDFVESDADKLMNYYAPYINAELMNTMEHILKSNMHQSMARTFLQMPRGITFDKTNDDIFLKPYFVLMKKLEKIYKC